MSTAPSVTTEPVAIWDTREESWSGPHRQARSDWVKARGLPADEIYRIEFYAGDPSFARVFTYARNERGQRHLAGHVDGPHDHDRCAVAVNPAYEQPVRELPPREIL